MCYPDPGPEYATETLADQRAEAAWEFSYGADFNRLAGLKRELSKLMDQFSKETCDEDITEDAINSAIDGMKEIVFDLEMATGDLEALKQ